MYVYDDFDRTLVDERVREFRDQVNRRLSGELTEEEFKPLRLMNGVYLQLHAYMLRIAIPYGTLSSDQMRMLAHVARRYDRNYGHFTTRQNIQFNWIKLEELPDAMADLARAGLHGMQTSGNCVRNITTDQWAGVAPDEIEDPRIWAELLRQHLTLHPEFSFLPRKFKIALTASAHDRAAVKIHDIGLHMHRNGVGETGFEVMVGGGLGRTPFLGKTIKPFLPKRDLLSYVEAIMRTYNQYGRRDNIYKARIKILVHELGAEKFAREVEEEWQSIKDGALALDPAVVADIAARFRYPDYEALEDDPPELAKARTDNRFRVWLDNSVANHKLPGYAIVTPSLKPEGGPPGDATARQMDAIADLAERYSFGEIRVGHEQNLALPHVAQRDLPALWRALDEIGVATPNVNLSRHHRLPRARLLQSGQRALDPGGRGDLAPLQGPRFGAQSRTAAHQHLRLHQCLRSPSHRARRHPRRREERRGILPGDDRRPRRRERRARQDPGAGGAVRGDRRRGRGCRRRLSRAARAAGRAFHRHRRARRHRSLQGAGLCGSLRQAVSSKTASCACSTTRRCRKASPPSCRRRDFWPTRASSSCARRRPASFGPTIARLPSSLRISTGSRSLLWCFRPSATVAPTVRPGSCANAINFAANCVQRVKSCAINCCFCIAPASTPSR